MISLVSRGSIIPSSLTREVAKRPLDCSSAFASTPAARAPPSFTPSLFERAADKSGGAHDAGQARRVALSLSPWRYSPAGLRRVGDAGCEGCEGWATSCGRDGGAACRRARRRAPAGARSTSGRGGSARAGRPLPREPRCRSLRGWSRPTAA